MTKLDIPWWLCQDGDDGNLILDPEVTDWCAENLSSQPVADLNLTVEWNEDLTGITQHYTGSATFKTVDDALFFKIKWL